MLKKGWILPEERRILLEEGCVLLEESWVLMEAGWLWLEEACWRRAGSYLRRAEY